jgi:hypothetical protein
MFRDQLLNARFIVRDALLRIRGAQLRASNGGDEVEVLFSELRLTSRDNTIFCGEQ